MKTLWIALASMALLAGGLYGCREANARKATAPVANKTERLTSAAEASGKGIPAAKTPGEAVPGGKDLSSAERLAFFEQNKLAPLIGGATAGDNQPMNGFYGPDHRRIELYMANIEADPQRPGTFLIKGKTRYKGTITPVSGQLTFERVALMKTCAVADTGALFEPQDDLQPIYVLLGTFRLAEDRREPGAGIFAGKAYMDVHLHKTEGPQYSMVCDSPTQHCGLKLDGNWTSYKTSTTKPVLMAYNIFDIGETILPQFSIGEREVEINPKYRDLGWDNYWENKEWWAEPMMQ